MALDDVQTLLEDTDEQLALVFRLHDESAESGVMSRRFKPRIKNVVENQRSVLDYLAYEVHQRHGRPTKVKIYYPSPPTLRSSTPTSTTGCQACELRVPTWPRRSSATSRSPKNGCAGSPNLRNENGHRVLTKHVEGQETRTDLRLADGGTASIQGIGVIGPDGTPLHPSAAFTGWTSYTDVPITVWRFADPPLIAPNALLQIQSGVRKAVSDVAQVAGL